MDLISIIVPVYNVEKYIYQCVDSIINQTYTNIEIILVDDGSPDNCGKICDEYAQKDSRIKVIHKSNGGLSDARNHGIDVATGEWLMFVDSDDWIESDMAEKLYEAVSVNNAQIAQCKVVLFDEEKEFIPDNFIVDAGCFSGLELLKRDVILTAFVVAWNKLYHKTIFSNLRYQKGIICEDEQIIHRILYRAERVCVLDDILYHYRQTPTSIMGNKYSANRLDYFTGMAQRVKFYYNNSTLLECAEKVLEAYFWALDIIYFKIEKRPGSRKKMRKCRWTTLKLLPYCFRESNIHIKTKFLRLLFCFFPSIYQLLTHKN